MDAAADVDVNPDFFDIDLYNLDDFDFDLAADEFCNAYAHFVADADKTGAGAAEPGGWLAGSGVIDGLTGSSSRESTPDSGVMDGPFAGEGSGSMSEYVCELERFLLENNDDEEEVVACPHDDELGVDDYFGDLLAAVEGGTAMNTANEEESLDAREDDEEPASRKRARHKIRGTTMMPCSWEELEVTRRHLAPTQGRPALWLPAAPPLRWV